MLALLAQPCSRCWRRPAAAAGPIGTALQWILALLALPCSCSWPYWHCPAVDAGPIGTALQLQQPPLALPCSGCWPSRAAAAAPPGTDLQLQLALLRAALLVGAEAVFEGFLRLREAPEERMHQSVELLRLHGDETETETETGSSAPPHSRNPTAQNPIAP